MERVEEVEIGSGTFLISDVAVREMQIPFDYAQGRLSRVVSGSMPIYGLGMTMLLWFRAVGCPARGAGIPSASLRAGSSLGVIRERMTPLAGWPSFRF